MRFDINITGADQAAARLRNLSAQMDSISLRALYNELESLVTWLEGEVKQRAPYDTGVLRNSIFSEVRVNGAAITGLVSTPMVYGPPMEFGRAAGRRMPPSDALKNWTRRHLGDEKLAFVVARSIGKKGIQKQEMFQNAWKDNLSRITSLLNDMGVHVTEELLRNL